MVEGKDIFIISLPLAAGVLCTASLTNEFPYFAGHFLIASVCHLALCIAICPALLWQWRRRHRPKNPCCPNGSAETHHNESPINLEAPARSIWMWVVIFLLLGAFCCSTAKIIGYATKQRAIFSSAKAEMERVIDSIPFAEKENIALVKALILGDKSKLSNQTTNSFRTAGAAHLLALSGMHLGVIYLIISKLFKIMGNSIPARKFRNLWIIIVTGLYTLLCGAGASLVRAWLFILLNESSKLLNRPQKPQQIFCAALTLHLIFNPLAATQIGFQLSYLAMMGIIFLWPKVKDWYPACEASATRFSPGKKIWDAATLSICCQIFTAPLTMLYFGTFPKYFLITNLVAAPLMSIVMFCGVAAIVLTQFPSRSDTIFMDVLEWPMDALRILLETIAGM